MRLAVTGGGTGGHVYPALEVAKLAVAAGDEVCYFGSFRGIEGSASQAAGVPFVGFRSEPIPRLLSPSGIRTAFQILRSAGTARRKLSEWRADVVFSTGGYAASPVLTATKSLGIPLVLHEQNSVPGRTNKMASNFARKVCIVFDKAKEVFGDKAVVTGMPLRQSLIDASQTRQHGLFFFTLSYGGSQGSAALNETVQTMASRVGEGDNEWLQITGPRQFEEVAKRMERILPPKNFEVKAFLQADELAKYYQRTSLAIVRSGCGTIAELALFGIPAIYVPLPHAHANHQYFNAKAIEAMGGGTVLEQQYLTPEVLEREWREWRTNDERRVTAMNALKSWSKPDATPRVLSVVKEVFDAPSN